MNTKSLQQEHTSARDREALETEMVCSGLKEKAREEPPTVVSISVKSFEPALRTCQICGPGGAGY
jgi:hypothetical protein